MNSTFERMMADATRLTRTGDLRAATAAIQGALQAAGRDPAATGDDGVVDVQAREVHEGDEDHAARDVHETPPPRHAGPAPEAGRFIAGRHRHAAAGERDYKVYVPPGYHGQPLPLVVMLHGCTQDPDDFAAGTRMNELAREHNVLVLYPAQAQSVNPSRCWNWFKHSHQRRGRGEPALLADMTGVVAGRYGVDRQRVYVAGLSAGGAMAAILGDTYPDLFAAVGVHSGLPAGAATDVKGAFDVMKRGAAAPAARRGTPPTIVFHGDRDATVHPLNGRHVVAARAGAATPERDPTRRENGRDVTREVYRDAEGRVVAEHWLVHGQGHAWCGGSPLGSYTDATGPDASRQMLRFFGEQVLGRPVTPADD